MERNSKGNLLRVERISDGGVAVKIKGTGEEIFTNWAIATHEVCERLHVPPFVLANVLPGLMDEIEHGIDGRVSIDLEAVRKAKEAGHGDRG